ncbi:MAG TPA: molybdopterin converting factor subunit 1 [Oceanospirillaceae bacterium]|nr:molybdopterin converting factor subunit 1 [Oceanospirillaceae bacterium]
MITILFFGRLKEQLDCGQLQIPQETALTVKELKQTLIELHPDWQEYLLDEQVLVAVNQTMATINTQVDNQAEVAFFPPVTGG